LFCPEHDLPEAECGICRPAVVGELEPGQGLKVRLPSKDSASFAGVETGVATRGSATEGVDCLAEIAFNGNKLAQIVAPVDGIIQAVTADLGVQVEEEETVAELWSASIAEAVANAILTHQTLDRERALRAENVSSEQDLQLAEATHRAACQKLRTLGFTEDQIHNFSNDPQTAVMLQVKTPFAGEIIERSAVQGSLVEAGAPLFAVADRALMWAELSIPETALEQVALGQEVELWVDALPGRVFRGRLTWISASVDDRTRMTQARAEIPNPEGTLKNRMFARARVLTGHQTNALLVPPEAVQEVEGQSLVFVKLAPDLYEARVVSLGGSSTGLLEIREGLAADEQLVLRRGYGVKSQLLLSRLGAGCVHD
jgi:cobalt-zinc-cadmium efflux system membrane fusion protein